MLNLNREEFIALKSYLNSDIELCKRNIESYKDNTDAGIVRWVSVLKRKVERLEPVAKKVNEEWDRVNSLGIEINLKK